MNEIVACYIRAGVDVVNLQQPRALGIEETWRDTETDWRTVHEAV